MNKRIRKKLAKRYGQRSIAKFRRLTPIERAKIRWRYYAQYMSKANPLLDALRAKGALIEAQTEVHDNFYFSYRNSAAAVVIGGSAKP